MARRSDSPDGQRRTRTVKVPVSPAEGEALDEWSEREGTALAELIRDVALDAAQGEKKR